MNTLGDRHDCKCDVSADVTCQDRENRKANFIMVNGFTYVDARAIADEVCRTALIQQRVPSSFCVHRD